MRTITLIGGIVCCALLIPGTVLGVPYPADRVVPLPVPPSPDYTNHDQWGFDLPGGTYTVQVENTLDFTHWKEWSLMLSVAPIVQGQPWFADFHINYSHQVQAEPALWENDVISTPLGPKTAIWQSYYHSWSPEPIGGEIFTVVGYPFLPGLPTKVDPQNANLVVDTLPFDYNPQWVSLEFEGSNVMVHYIFTDWCIPEPATLALAGLGGLLIQRRRR